MKTSKTGIQLRYLAALSFFFIFFDQAIISILIVGAAIYIEKDEWLSRQTLQALFLKVFSNFVISVLGSSTLISKINTLQIYGYDSYYDDIFDYLSGVDIFKIILIAAFGITVFIFIIMAIVRTLKEQDAGIPFFSGLSYKMFGMIKPIPMPPQPQQYYYNQNQQVNVNTYQPAPQQQAQATPVQPVQTAPAPEVNNVVPPVQTQATTSAQPVNNDSETSKNI